MNDYHVRGNSFQVDQDGTEVTLAVIRNGEFLTQYFTKYEHDSQEHAFETYRTITHTLNIVEKALK